MYRNSLPLDRSGRCPIKGSHITAIERLSSCELEYEESKWHLPRDHPFSVYTIKYFNGGSIERDLHEMRSTWNALKQH